MINLQEQFFWDTEFSGINPEKNAAYIVDRVLHYGSIKDWQVVRAYYGLQLEWYGEKYGNSSTFHAVRSLTYFDDAEEDRSNSF